MVWSDGLNENAPAKLRGKPGQVLAVDLRGVTCPENEVYVLMVQSARLSGWNIDRQQHD
jgi:hypothetical protein